MGNKINLELSNKETRQKERKKNKISSLDNPNKNELLKQMVNFKIRKKLTGNRLMVSKIETR